MEKEKDEDTYYQYHQPIVNHKSSLDLKNNKGILHRTLRTQCQQLSTILTDSWTDTEATFTNYERNYMNNLGTLISLKGIEITI